MEALYLPIRHVHITAVLISGALLLLRAVALNAFGARWVIAAPLRYLSWTIDTVLLGAALILTTIIQQYPFADGWLTVKVLLLVPYVVRSEEHTSELQSRENLVCRLLLEKKA